MSSRRTVGCVYGLPNEMKGRCICCTVSSILAQLMFRPFHGKISTEFSMIRVYTPSQRELDVIQIYCRCVAVKVSACSWPHKRQPAGWLLRRTTMYQQLENITTCVSLCTSPFPSM